MYSPDPLFIGLRDPHPFSYVGPSREGVQTIAFLQPHHLIPAEHIKRLIPEMINALFD